MVNSASTHSARPKCSEPTKHVRPCVRKSLNEHLEITCSICSTPLPHTAGRLSQGAGAKTLGELQFSLCYGTTEQTLFNLTAQSVRLNRLPQSFPPAHPLHAALVPNPAIRTVDLASSAPTRLLCACCNPEQPIRMREMHRFVRFVTACKTLHRLCQDFDRPFSALAIGRPPQTFRLYLGNRHFFTSTVSTQ